MYESIDWRQSTKGGEEFARFSSHTSTRAGCRKRVSGRVPDSISFDFNRNLENDEKCKLTLIKQKFILHPLIYTPLQFTLVQDIDYFQLGKKRNPTDRSSERPVRATCRGFKLGIIEGGLTSSH
jgi:hypothetical protein